MISTVHLQTGLHYVHVIPHAWGAHVDVHACYSRLAQQHSWISVMSQTDFEAGNGLQDPQNFFVLWCLPDPGPRENRKAFVTVVYSEALANDMSILLPDHLRDWNRFLGSISRYDAVFGHTPWMVERLGSAGISAHLLPVGWDPEAMGSPRWTSPKHDELVFYGSLVGKRALVLPYLKEKLGNRLKDISGSFGRTLTGALDVSKASLYVAHSDVDSFSTWRLWQTAASSAALIAESGDTWPFVSGEHIVPIPRITFSNIDAVIDRLKELLDTSLEGYARKAHELARLFTVDHCVDHYLVPASAKIIQR